MKSKMSSNTKLDRMKLVACMEFIARHVNDEELFNEKWLTYGVADGDIPYGHIPVSTYKEDNLEYYVENDVLPDLIDEFLSLMYRAYTENSGLYVE